MITLRKTLMVLLAAGLLVGSGCGENSVEKDIDNATGDVQDAGKDALNEVEEAGKDAGITEEDVKDAADDAAGAVEDTAEDVEDELSGGAEAPEDSGDGGTEAPEDNGGGTEVPDGAGRRLSARAWAGFFGLAVLWGIPYLFIKVAVDDGMPPVFLAWARVDARRGRAAGAGGARGQPRSAARPRPLDRRSTRWSRSACPFPLIGYGEQHVSSSLAAILVAAVPTFVALLAALHPAERLTGRGRRAGCRLRGRRGAGRDRHRRGDRRAARRRRDPARRRSATRAGR